MDFGEGKYDFILAEGGALTYIGREEGIEKCASLLKEGHCLAFTDLIYLRDDVAQPIRDAYEEGVFKYMTEIEYRKMLEAYGFEIVFMAMLPQSAWDRYYMQMRRKMLDKKNAFTKEFKDSMTREIDVYYNFGGMFMLDTCMGLSGWPRRNRLSRHRKICAYR